jgi:hypothetical protein
MDKQWFFEKNQYLLDHKINVTFDEILRMTEEEFVQWVVELRKAVVYSWDVLGIPPRMGYNKAEIIEQFYELYLYNLKSNDLLCVDELTGQKDLIRNSTSLGNAVNQFFPTMMKTRINYTQDVKAGKSIYDFFAKDELFPTFLTYARRHFKRDSFYNHSLHVDYNDKTMYEVLPQSKTGVEWVQKFEESFRKRKVYDYWLAPVKEDFEYTGYAEHLKHAKRLTLNRAELEAVWEIIPGHCKSNVDFERSEVYRLRYFAPGQRLFPIGFKNFRVSFCQYAVNFPPLTAKWVYERFTKEWKGEATIYVWDPSAGWGGRLLGCLAASHDRHLTYLGNDPNTDHNTTPGRTKYHEIYDLYTANIRKGGMDNLPHNDFKFWQLGSEVMQHDPEFQQYKGKLSLVFTSPPYFAKERYSEDPEQSCIKFDGYHEWKSGFLLPTLYTAVQWLRPGGYLVWNVADVQFGGEMLPLEEDSKAILETLGMHYEGFFKMALGSMPGGNRVDPETGLPKAKNFAKTQENLYEGMRKRKVLWLKYEPLFVFRKS